MSDRVYLDEVRWALEWRDDGALVRLSTAVDFNTYGTRAEARVVQRRLPERATRIVKVRVTVRREP